MTDHDLHYLSLVEVSERMRHGALSPVALTDAMLDRIARLDGGLTSYITVAADHARRRARQAADEISRGFWRGPLHGVPIAVKDLVETSFAPTTGGMPLRRGHVAAENATVITRLEAAGAVLLGKLAMTEGAFLFHHPAMPAPTNPWARDLWSGASSSGSGVATAAGMCFASLGSDTGGSIRLPSAACGLTGVKPTWGRVSRHGVLPLAESMDHIGPMARNAADAAAVLQVVAGPDPYDPTALHAPVPNYLDRIGEGVSGVRIGLDRAALADDIDPQVAAAVEAAAGALASRGARILPVTLPSADALLEGFPVICATEARIAHRGTFPARRADYGEGLAGLLDEADQVTPAALAGSMLEVRRYGGRLEALLADVDLLLVPVMPFAVPTVDAIAAMIARGVPTAGRFMTPFNMTGHPTITLNGGFDSNGAPIGFQLVGRHLDEAGLLIAGHAFQQATDWHTRHPI